MYPEVLIVEDDDAIRKLLVIALRRAGLTVDEAADGFEALARIANTPYRLVILDLMMPKVDGRAVVAAVRAMPAPRPRLMLTTAAGNEDVAAVRPQIDAIFSKPFDIMALVAAATTLVTRHDEAPGAAATPPPSSGERPAA